jgi:asparagine synthase (glutamine-hydrolysing)
MGFAAPIGDWFRGRLGDVFADTVLASDAVTRDHLDQAVARELHAAHRSGFAEHDGELWALLMFELWARRWLGAPVTA